MTTKPPNLERDTFKYTFSKIPISSVNHEQKKERLIQAGNKIIEVIRERNLGLREITANITKQNILIKASQLAWASINVKRATLDYWATFLPHDDGVDPMMIYRSIIPTNGMGYRAVIITLLENLLPFHHDLQAAARLKRKLIENDGGRYTRAFRETMGPDKKSFGEMWVDACVRAKFEFLRVVPKDTNSADADRAIWIIDFITEVKGNFDLKGVKVEEHIFPAV